MPLVRQATEYSCGAAALMSTLMYWGVFGGGESSLYPLLETTEQDGTHPLKLVEGARDFGLDAEFLQNLGLDDLRQRLAQGYGIILDIQAWQYIPVGRPRTPWASEWESGHYVVLVGMDAEYAYFMDPSVGGNYGYIPLGELLERWHDYEDRTGAIERHVRSAVLVRGSQPPTRNPDALVRIE
jgi:hypothetical protein